MPHTDDHTVDSVIEAKRSVERILREKENVHAVSVGHKEVGGEETDDLAIVVHVTSKKAEADLEESDIVPARINVAGRDPIPTDVRETEIPSASMSAALPYPYTEHRPVFGGIEGAPSSGGGAGTIGAPVETDTGGVRLLTNRHVATTVTGSPSIGEGFSQPAGGPTIGTLAEWSEMDPDSVNRSDSALIEPNSDIDVANYVAGAGPLGTPESAILGGDYIVSGRTSRLTAANAMSVSYSGAINYDGTIIEFDELLELDPVTDLGDSGSIWGRYDRDDGTLHPVGLHFAGGSEHKLAVPWETLEEVHGSLSPLSEANHTDVTPVRTTNWARVAPIALQTGDRAVLECVGTRYGSPSAPSDGTVQLHQGGLTDDGQPSGRQIAEAEITAPWGEPEVIEFSGLMQSLGTGNQRITIDANNSSARAYTITIIEPAEHRVYGSVRTEHGERIADVTVDIYDDRNQLIDRVDAE